MGSKNHEIDPIIRLPVVGTAIDIKSLKTAFDFVKLLKKFFRKGNAFRILNIVIKYKNDTSSPIIVATITAAAAYSIP